MSKFDWPKVSVVIPTFNEEKNLLVCLESIFKQTYPRDKLEVIVVDDCSTDKTLEVAKKFPVKVLISGARHGEVSKMIGFKKARGEYAIYLDADVELIGKDWFQKMTRPLLEDESIIGSFTRKYSKRSDPTLERYYGFDSLQRDSIYQFFSPSIENTIGESREGYFICIYKEGQIPPAGRCLYRRKKLLELVSGFDMFLELDFLVLLTRNGLNKFAYVPEAGLYHHHVGNLDQLLRKRKYNLRKVYLARSKRFYKWFDPSLPKDVFKIIVWVIYANLIIPSILVGIYKTLKYRDWAGMYEPVVNLVVTDIIVISFLTNPRGRKLLIDSFHSIF